MRMRFAFSALCAVAALWTGCDDTPVAIGERWVYFSQFAGRGMPDSGIGLSRYGIVSGRLERVSPFACRSISNVAANGIVLMQRGDGYFGRCEDGAIVPVPVPVPSDPHFICEPDLTADFMLAHDGHAAVYKAWVHPAGSAGRDSSWKQQLVVVNCAQGSTRVIEADAYARAAFGDRGCDAGVANGPVLISRDGSTVFFALLAMSSSPAGTRTIGSCLLRWRDGAISPADAFRDGETLALRGYDETAGVLVFERTAASGERRVCAMTPGGRDRTVLPIEPDALVSPRQFAVLRSEVAVPGPEGIDVRLPADGRLIRHVITWNRLIPSPPAEARNADDTIYRVSISPDGGGIACSVGWVHWAADPPVWTTVYACRSDGADVRRIASFVGMESIPAISDLISAR